MGSRWTTRYASPLRSTTLSDHSEPSNGIGTSKQRSVRQRANRAKHDLIKLAVRTKTVGSKCANPFRAAYLRTYAATQRGHKRCSIPPGLISLRALLAIQRKHVNTPHKHLDVDLASESHLSCRSAVDASIENRHVGSGHTLRAPQRGGATFMGSDN